MIAKLTLASVAFALLALPNLISPAQAFEGPTATVQVGVIVLQPPTLTTTGLAKVTLLNTTTNLPVTGEFVHITIAYGPAPGVLRSSITQQVAAKTDANGVAVFTLPFDSTLAKLNQPGRHVVTAFLDGTVATADQAYQAGTGLA